MFPLQSLEGMVADADGNPAPKGVVLHLLPNGHYTTTNRSSRFAFYNVPEGDYVIQLVENSLPESARTVSPTALPVAVRYGTAPVPVSFRYETGPHDPNPQREVRTRPERVVLFSMGSRKEQPRSKRRIITNPLPPEWTFLEHFSRCYISSRKKIVPKKPRRGGRF